MADEHFHEIQLSGKQLVFLFMATAVVAVVIFLTGVLVGRGARAAVENTAAGGVLEGPADSGPAPLVPASSPDAVAAAGRPPATGGPPAPASEEFSYYTQLQGAAPKAAAPARPPVTPEVEPLRERGAASDGCGRDRRRRPRAGTTCDTTRGTGGRGRPSACGRAVRQPALWRRSASRQRGGRAADGLLLRAGGRPRRSRRRPTANSASCSPRAIRPTSWSRRPARLARFFRVRVGHFTTRAEADDMRRRLEKDQYKTLITR